jgi:hypothetical protein
MDEERELRGVRHDREKENCISSGFILEGEEGVRDLNSEVKTLEVVQADEGGVAEGGEEGRWGERGGRGGG